MNFDIPLKVDDILMTKELGELMYKKFKRLSFENCNGCSQMFLYTYNYIPQYHTCVYSGKLLTDNDFQKFGTEAISEVNMKIKLTKLENRFLEKFYKINNNRFSSYMQYLNLYNHAKNMEELRKKRRIDKFHKDFGKKELKKA